MYIMKRIKLSKGKFALVDDADYEYLSQYKWYYLERKSRTTGKVLSCYARTSIKAGSKHASTSMHRLLMNPPKGMVVDHRDHDGLNNQRYNLRVCTYSQNAQNTKPYGSSKYSGVYLCKLYNKWYLKLTIDGTRRGFGRFDTELEAGIISNLMIRKYFKEYGKTIKH